MPYTKNGINFPRCTAIISDATDSSGALTQWAANMVVVWIKKNCEIIPYPTPESENNYLVHPDELNKARFEFRKVSQTALDIGSEVHNAIEKHLQDKDYNTLTTKEAENGFQAFLAWEKEVDLKPIALEQTVWGDRWAGTEDYLGYYKGKLYVIDWKTSKAFYPEMRYQVAAYRSVSGDNVEGCGVLRLDKETGLPKFHDTSKTYESDLAVFNCMVTLYYLRHPIVRKRFEV